MALSYQAQIDLLIGQFKASLLSLTWGAVANEIEKVRTGKKPLKPRKKDKLVLEATPKNVKAALYHDHLTQPENGWWTRDNFNYYRPTTKVEGDGVETWYFRKFGDENNQHPIKVKFSTLVNRWKYFTNEELNKP